MNTPTTPNRSTLTLWLALFVICCTLLGYVASGGLVSALLIGLIVAVHVSACLYLFVHLPRKTRTA